MCPDSSSPVTQNKTENPENPSALIGSTEWAGQEMQTAIETAARMIADAATRQGARLSVAEIEERLFLELSNELQHRQVTRRVCADMFAMNPRTYQRKLSTYRVKVQSRSASL